MTLPQAGQSPRRPGIASRLVLFVLAGPPIAMLILILLFVPVISGSGNYNDVFAEPPQALAGIALLLGYLLGFLPALLTGIVYAVLERWTWNVWARALFTMLVAGLLGLAPISLPLLRVAPAPQPGSDPSALYVIVALPAIAAFLSAGICALIATLAWRRRPPSTSDRARQLLRAPNGDS